MMRATIAAIESRRAVETRVGGIAKHPHPIANQRRQPLDASKQFALLVARRLCKLRGDCGEILAHYL